MYKNRKKNGNKVIQHLTCNHFLWIKKDNLKKSTIITNVKRLNKNQIKPDVDFVFKKPISSCIQYYK